MTDRIDNLHISRFDSKIIRHWTVFSPSQPQNGSGSMKEYKGLDLISFFLILFVDK
jgi:hypothetical protein